MSYKINKHVDIYLKMVENDEILTCLEQKKLCKHVRKAFETEKIYVDDDQFERYLGLQKYLPYKLFPWQKFIMALHLSTYYEENNMPRWPVLFAMIGRGAGKDGLISFEAMALSSHYNGIKNYDVDICANNELQAKRPVMDLVEFFETHRRRLWKRFFYWTKENIKSLKTGAIIRGHTNNHKGKDGLRSGVVIFNEYHAYENYENINVFTTGLGKKKHPRRSIFTTDGDVIEGPLDDLKEESKKILDGEKDDNGMLPFICKLPSKDMVHDPRNWEMANPSLRYFPDLKAEIEQEYREWSENPAKSPSFMTKRMNLRESNLELQVTSWDNILSTSKPIPNLSGKSCICGIDYSKTTDWVAVNLHFKIDDNRYDINHAWVCKNSYDLPRITAPWKDWAREGHITVVDDVEIHPSLITDYIRKMKQSYNILKVCIDDYRYALITTFLKEIGFDAKEYKNVKLVRPSDKMKIYPLIESCFANQYFHWGEAPHLRWATWNTKLVRVKQSALSQTGQADSGNYLFDKIEPKSRKTDPFMALVHSMVEEHNLITYKEIPKGVDFSVKTY